MLTYYISDNNQLGYASELFNDSYIPRTAVIGKDYKVKYNSSGILPEETDLINWIEELNSAEIDLQGINDKSIILEQNYPNPFNNTTNICYNLATDEQIKIDVYNSSGQLVKNIINDRQQSGFHSITFNSEKLVSGLYYYKLESGGKSYLKKMVLAR